MERSEGHLGGYILGRAAPGTWCPAIWDWLIEDHEVRSMLDVGCGLGYVVKYFRDKGLDAAGVDGSPSALRDGVAPDLVHAHDFTLGPWVPDREYDLVWSAEFLEHVEERFMGNFFLAFRRARRFVVVTYAVPGQGGHHHVNENTEEYWVERFRWIDFELDPGMTATARALVPQEGNQGKQFRRKGLVFRRQSSPAGAQG